MLGAERKVINTVKEELKKRLKKLEETVGLWENEQRRKEWMLKLMKAEVDEGRRNLTQTYEAIKVLRERLDREE